jgi:hypothetical protein
MLQTVTVSSNTPSIVFIREVYAESSLSTEAKEVTAYGYGCGEVFLTAEQRPTFVKAIEVDDWLKFQQLARDWRSQRGVMSSITEAVLCPAYQSIIGMGASAVPFMLEKLEEEAQDPDQWFWALKAVTGDDPVRDEDRGDFVAMAQSWIEWGRRQGYAW